MNVLVLVLNGVVWWRVNEAAPTAFQFRHRTGWTLLSPLLYPKLMSSSPDERYTVFAGPPDEPEAALVCTNLICLETPFSKIADATHWLFEDSPRFLGQLRFVSKFAKAPTSLQTSYVVNIDDADLRTACTPSQKKRAAIGGFNINAALTVPKIEEFVELRADFEPPIYGRLLLDAILAQSSGDYRKSILYTAIAAETLAATKLDEAYTRILEQEATNKAFRVISSRELGSVLEKRDPVYEELRRGARGQMRKYLHPLPLYLLGKSLLVDDKPLYDSILAVHDQRNSIAHTGGPEIDQDPQFSSNHSTVAEGIRQVARLFIWFGEPGVYPILNEGVMLG